MDRSFRILGRLARCSELNLDDLAGVLPDPGRINGRFGQRSPVLYGGDQPILNLLPPEPAPARPFEPVIVCRIGKTAFHQMLTPPPVPPGRRTVGLDPRPIQKLLIHVTMDGPARG